MSGIPQLGKPTLKIILVGDSGVGKTCLLSAYFKQKFEYQTNPTVAPSYSCIDIKLENGYTLCLQIWDTAGQERYHSISKLFFRDSDVAFICFQAGDEQSTKEIVNWVTRVREEVPTCTLFFVMTKADLHTPEQNQQFKQEVIPQIQGYDCQGPFLTSSLTKEGVNELFQAAAKVYKGPNKSPSQVTNRSLEDKNNKPCC